MKAPLTLLLRPLLLLLALATVSAPVPSTRPAAGAAPAAAPTSAQGNRLVGIDGRPLFLVGVNYVGAPDRSWSMWQNDRFDAGLVERDFRRAREAGFNAVRLFVRPPLHQELAAGRWEKLDQVIRAARQTGLLLILTLADYREDDLQKVAAMARAIASRYRAESTILAYDLKNEPHFQNLATPIYPGERPPLQTDQLIRHYGERLSEAEAAAWRQGEGAAQVPARFSAREAYLYANNLRFYREFLAEASAWVAARRYDVSTLDFVDSAESAKWQPLLEALSATLAAWLEPQVAAIRAEDPARLLTVGHSDLVLARLPANRALSFLSVHRFPAVGNKPLRMTLALLKNVQRAFPDRPVVLEEFGYPTSAVDPPSAAAHEAMLWLGIHGAGLAGGLKWSLYDVAGGFDPRENSFGAFRTDGSPKPIVGAAGLIADHLARGAERGELALADDGGLLRAAYRTADGLFVATGGEAWRDDRFAFEPSAAGQILASWAGPGGSVWLAATVAGRVTLDLPALVGVPVQDDLRLEGPATPPALARQGSKVSFAVEAGQRYRLRYRPALVDARVQIVWPHDEQNRPAGVASARSANVRVYLYEGRREGARRVAGCDWEPRLRLVAAVDGEPAGPLSLGLRALSTAMPVAADGRRFPAWDFNDVDVSAATRPRADGGGLSRLYFTVLDETTATRSNVWAHAADARSYEPAPAAPARVATGVPTEVRSRVQIVWPHDQAGRPAPVAEAPLANVTALLSPATGAAGGLESVSPRWNPTVRLHRAIDDGVEEPVAVGRQRLVPSDRGFSYPVWDFNNVDVSAARNPLTKIAFRVKVDGPATTLASVWSHGADARTIFPQPDVPAAGCW